MFPASSGIQSQGRKKLTTPYDLPACPGTFTGTYGVGPNTLSISRIYPPQED